jgi:hypothetical protein
VRLLRIFFKDENMGDFFKFLIELPNIWEKLIYPLLKRMLFFLTQALPNGLIVWWVLYWAAEHPARLTEPGVFLSLLGQATLLASIYGIFWGMVVYPSVKCLIAPSSPEKQKE